MFDLRTRRIFSITIVVLFAISLLVFPKEGSAGHLTGITDQESSRLIGYWDLRDRDTFFQVTNTSESDVRVHIQLYVVSSDVTTGCVEIDYFDSFTPGDTHVYDVSDLDRNNGITFNPPVLTGGHGILAVTVVDSSDSFSDNQVLTGNFSIIDGAGYEYRTNLAGAESTSPSDDYIVNFNGVDGSVFADFVVIGVNYVSSPGGVVPVTEEYFVETFDENENPISCPVAVLGCAQTDIGGGVINVGINQAVTNTKGGPSLCAGTDPVGFLQIDASRSVNNTSFSDDSDAYIHFIGLNNGAGTGSIDSVVGD